MKNKGITLVALVITIIILLILAAISIQALTNQGLFTQAQNAKNLTEEKAAQADFCNPQFVDFKITSEKQWEKYRYLFQMHINLKLIEQHLRLGRTYDKKCIYFYDAPWKDEYLRNMQKALECYQAGLYYWQEAKLWCEKANTKSFNFLYITEKQNWEDERERIVNGELDYEKMLTKEILY